MSGVRMKGQNKITSNVEHPFHRLGLEAAFFRKRVLMFGLRRSIVSLQLSAEELLVDMWVKGFVQSAVFCATARRLRSRAAADS
jgi:hypothetical protein